MIAAASADFDADQLLRTIATGTADVVGEEFFRALTRCLAQALGFRVAFASEFTAVHTRVCTLAFYDKGEFLDNFEYDLEHTPCELVLKGEVGYYPCRVQELFPHHKDELAELDAESYIAIPIIHRDGRVLGHIAAIHDQPLSNPVREMSVFKIFGMRAAAELERRQAELALKRSERHLANVLGSAMDAILTVDANHRITLFNQAAEHVFRCSAAWAIGQPAERFLTRPTRSVLHNTMSADARERRQLWAPEGLSAVRADGEEFPIEATVSPLRSDDGLFYTIILRDVNERERAFRELRRMQTAAENLQEELLRRQQVEVEGFIGGAPAMQQVLAHLKQVATTDATVLITGETGTGKELLANAIHRASPRANRPFVAVNCAALPSELIESELFGHERGAFTGATTLRRGRFELANEGTIFLDEVGELSPQAQAKLLRALQEHRFERVGGSDSLRVDVRVVAATNRKLADMVAAGTFRADLYYRLNVFPLSVPPLRERREDIALLAQFFLERNARKLGKELTGFSALSLERLRRYAWPGNVRELQNVIERAAILSAGPLVDLRDPLLDAAGDDAEAPPTSSADDVMRSHIRRVLEEQDWIVEGPSGAAALLDMKPSTLRHRMKQLGLSKPRRSSR